jgi:hypothetical protein
MKGRDHLEDWGDESVLLKYRIFSNLMRTQFLATS